MRRACVAVSIRAIGCAPSVGGWLLSVYGTGDGVEGGEQFEG